MAPPNFGVELVIGPSWQRVPDEQSTIVQVEGSPYRIPYSGLVLSEAVIGEIAGVMLQPLWTDALDLVIAIGGGGSWGGDIENRFVGAHWRANLGVQWRPWPSAGLEALVRYHGGYTQGVEQEYTFFHHALGAWLDAVIALPGLAGMQLLIGGGVDFFLSGPDAEAGARSWHAAFGARYMWGDPETATHGNPPPRALTQAADKILGEVQGLLADAAAVADEGFAKLVAVAPRYGPINSDHGELNAHVHVFEDVANWLTVPEMPLPLPYWHPPLDNIRRKIAEARAVAEPGSDAAALGASLEKRLDEVVNGHLHAIIRFLGSPAAGLLQHVVKRAQAIAKRIAEKGVAPDAISVELDALAIDCRTIYKGLRRIEVHSAVTELLQPRPQPVPAAAKEGDEDARALAAASDALTAMMWGVGTGTQSGIDPALTIPALRKKWKEMKE